MGAGVDAQIGAAKETTYGTRVAPTRFFEFLPPENLDFTYNYYLSPALGGGSGGWRRKRIQTTRAGGGTLPMEVPTKGFGFWLDLLHNQTPTVVQQGATPAYLQTHTLSSAPAKSATIQIGRPPTSGAVQPFDYLGCMVASWEFAWDPEGVLRFTPTIVARDQVTSQTLATNTPPSGAGLLSFLGGSISIAGSQVADITGGGTLGGSWPLRDDTFPLGSAGVMAKPVPTDKPAINGAVTADFTGLTHYNRVTHGTLADVVLAFQGALISGTYYELLRVTVPDCGFTGPPPNVEGPGPLTQSIQFQNASSVGNVPFIEYMSVDLAV